MVRYRARIQGVVQGVGFRPYLYQLAQRHAVTGHVCNDGEGVTLEVQGEGVQSFLDEIPERLPPIARIDRFTREPLPVVSGEVGFIILENSVGPSGSAGHASRERGALVTPDLMLCETCRQELHNPRDRRYLYPFLNCTACGPRFTIVRNSPYTRGNTSMDAFPLCRDCAAEYDDPGDRRFHAEPIACHRCGPRLHLLREIPIEGLVSFFERERKHAGDDLAAHQERIRGIFEESARLILSGGILALKGLGGWHLACDATNEAAVRSLRERKSRDEKPFAVMFSDAAMLATHASANSVEIDALTGYQGPIALLASIPRSLAPSVSPDGLFLGAMLPSTPMHELLLGFANRPLVMTSGNRSGNPTVYQDLRAFEELKGIADAFLIHDREIVTRCDDSVVRMDGTRPVFYRRSRGYAPDALPSHQEFSRTVFATGAFLNNAFAFGAGRRIFVGHHIGDLDHPSTIEAFRSGLEYYERLFDLRAECLVSDLHPDFPSTVFASEEAARRNARLVQVQHHEAHIASCLADNGFNGPALGLALDGTGLGRDGTIWGGELFRATPGNEGMERRGGLMALPMPGGEAAVREPWRMSLSLLSQAFRTGDSARDYDEAALLSEIERLPAFSFLQASARRDRHDGLRVVRSLKRDVLTSGCGRLFDAVSFLAGGPMKSSYEGQPAIRLESMLRFPGSRSSSEGDGYPWVLGRMDGRWILDPAPLASRLLADLRDGAPGFAISWRFHRGLVQALLELVRRAVEETGLQTIALSGGCLFNCYLSSGLESGLAGMGLRVLQHRNVPPGDGGIALGQLFLSGECGIGTASGDR